jgi:hypothetical protein
MMKMKDRATYVAVALVVIGIIFWIISDALSTWAGTANQILVAIAYILLSPWYVIVLAYMWVAYPDKRAQALVASLLVIVAVELISLPHIVTMNGQVPTAETSQFFLEVALFKSIPFLDQLGLFGTFFLYWLLPSLCIVLAHDLVADEAFIGLVAEELKKIHISRG